MKRIAFVTRVLSSGGAEMVLRQIVNSCAERGMDCLVLSVWKNERIPEFHPSVQIVELDPAGDGLMGKVKQYGQARKLICDFGAEIVLSMPEDIGIYMIPAMFGTGIPVVVSERNNPWVMPYKKVSRILRSLVYPFADGLIFQTERAASFFPESQQKKGIILPNPLELSRLPDVNEGRREKIVVSAGRLDPQKNFPLLISAFAKFHEHHPDYRLVIYGEGAERKKLEKLAAEKLPEGSWSMPGRVSDLPVRISQCEIFALSSDYEGVPNVLIEAMAVGTACVSTDCAPGGAAALIDHGQNGLIVPVQDENALASALEYMANNPEEAEIMAKSAVSIREKLDSKQVCEQWYQYIDLAHKRTKKKHRETTVTIRDRGLTFRYQTVLLFLFTLLVTLSGWAPALSDSTMATSITMTANRITIYGCLLGITAIYFRSPIQINSKFWMLLFTPVVYWCMYYFLRFDKSLPVNVTTVIILCLFVLLHKDNKRKVYRYFRRVLVILCFIGIISYALHLLHIDVFFTRYPYYTASLGGEYISYGMGAMYERGSLVRLCGHYNEPGFLGTVLALVLCIENLNLRKVGNVCMLIAGILSFSMAFWIILAVYMIIKWIPYILKKPKLLIAVIVLVVLYLFVLPHIKTGNESVDWLLQRLVITSDGFVGNNRENTMLQYLFDQTMSGRDFLLGNGAGYIKTKDIGAVSSYKTYVIEYGVLGFALIYGSLLLNAIRQARKNYNALAMIAVFALSIYQRPNVISLVYFTLLFGGIEHIKYRDGRERQKKVKK